MNQFNVGDYVTSHYKGVFRVDKIELRQFNTPLLHLTKVLSDKYKKLGGKVKCDSAWCQKITKEAIIKELQDKIDLVNGVMT